MDSNIFDCTFPSIHLFANSIKNKVHFSTTAIYPTFFFFAIEPKFAFLNTENDVLDGVYKSRCGLPDTPTLLSAHGSMWCCIKLLIVY